MSNILVVENLTKNFSGLVAVNNLSFTMKSRTIHSLIGPNGSGESTTINMCTGAFPMTSGTVKYKDELISGLVMHEIASKDIGRTFQNLKLFGSMTVKENLMVGMHSDMKDNIFKFILNPKAAKQEEKIAEEKALEILNYIGMYKQRDEIVKNLAYGQQKLTELGRTIMTNPKLLFLDEPAAGLNPSERVDFVKILIKVFEDGVDLFLIEHNMDVVMNISNYITVITSVQKLLRAHQRKFKIMMRLSRHIWAINLRRISGVYKCLKLKI